MSLSLKETQAISTLAEHLYSYLPASGAAFTFGEAAQQAGVAELWPGVKGLSKLPALTFLLEATLERRRERFCRLVERIVAGGIKYRTRKGNPLTRAELDQLNQLVLAVGFKIPELWAPDFLDALPAGKVATAPPTMVAPQSREAEVELAHALPGLRSEFEALHALKDRRQAGIGLESLLNRAFKVFGLEADKPFRVEGEQIDGSFVLDHEVYLLEAKWTHDRTDQKELYAFRVKVEGKSTLTRGLFFSVTGFTEPALAAIKQGKTPNFVMADGAHLHRVLSGDLRLDDLLRRLIHHLAERGEPYLPIHELG